MVMYRTGETKIFPFIFETCRTSNEYNTFSWYYLKYGTSTGTVPLRRIILERHNDKNKKTIKKVYPTGTGTLINKSRGLINIQSFSVILRTCSTQTYLLEKICLDIQFVQTLQNIAHQFLLELHCHR